MPFKSDPGDLFGGGQPVERLSGLIERVTFHSEESGFCVLQVKVKGWRDLATVIGTLPSATPGEHLEAEGIWVVDIRHGRQFKAHALRTADPQTREGIEKYLGSGMIRGIGPHFASRLVKAFGMRVFEVIESSPERLREVEGIGPVRAEKIRSAWKGQAAVREIMVFLHSNGVTTSRAFRIYKVYGEHAVETVTQNPYRLARDIRGIGFKSADAIAQRLNIPRDSPLRAEAGVEHALFELAGEGHCAFERESLADKAAELLEVEPTLIESALDAGVLAGRLVERANRRGKRLVYLSAMDRAEDRLAENLAGLALGRHPCPNVDMAKAIEWVEKKAGISLGDAQITALETALASKVTVVTGGPGVGKTTLVNSLIKILNAKRLKVVLCAPTGRAAKRLSESCGAEAKTVHRLLEFDPATGGFKRGVEKKLSGDVFVVDETSMLDLQLAHQLVRAVPDRAALVLVGDSDQLPSVGPGSVLKDIIGSGAFPVCHLTEVYRQAAQSAIITNAHRVNAGLMPRFPEKGESQGGGDFYFIEAEDPERACAIVKKLVAESIPGRFKLSPLDGIQVLTPMQRGHLGARNLNIQLQEALNGAGPSVSRFGWTYRVRDRVMQIENDYQKEVFNGDIGRISSIDGEEQVVEVDFDGRRVDYSFAELDTLTLAYATTVHKAQGSEYPAVVIPIHTQHYVMLRRNLLYTAITRARKLAVIVGTKKALAMAVKRKDALERVTTLAERIRAACGVGGASKVRGETLPVAAEGDGDYDP